jgi:hypothetical protein
VAGSFPAEIKALVEAVRPKRLNLPVVRDSGLSVADIAAPGGDRSDQHAYYGRSSEWLVQAAANAVDTERLDPPGSLTRRSVY